MAKRKFTEEHKQKLREAKLKNPTKYWLGKKRPEMVGHNYNEGREPWNKGVPWSEEQKQKLSEIQKGQRHSPNTEFKKGMAPANKRGWKYLKVKNRNGEVKLYRQILVENHPYGAKAKLGKKYVYEHRLVMEKHLGRYLLPGEVIHHINENTLDNNIENLQLFSSPGKHLKEGHGFTFAQGIQ